MQLGLWRAGGCLCVDDIARRHASCQHVCTQYPAVNCKSQHQQPLQSDVQPLGCCWRRPGLRERFNYQAALPPGCRQLTGFLPLIGLQRQGFGCRVRPLERECSWHGCRMARHVCELILATHWVCQQGLAQYRRPYRPTGLAPTLSPPAPLHALSVILFPSIGIFTRLLISNKHNEGHESRPAAAGSRLRRCGASSGQGRRHRLQQRGAAGGPRLRHPQPD